MTPVDKSAQNNWIVDQSQWFRVNYPYASTLLLQVFDEYEIFLERSRKHTKFTIDTFSEEKMFDKFYRSNKSDHIVVGIDLGLAICKAIMDIHGGTIVVNEAHPGSEHPGPVFTLTSPEAKDGE